MSERGRERKTPLRLAIWWLDQNSIEIIRHTGFAERLPVYLRREIDNREGRPGRKRLWVPREIATLGLGSAMENIDEIGAWDDSWGGVVFWFRDRQVLCFAPGFVTDMKGFIEEAFSNDRLRTRPTPQDNPNAS